MHPKLDGLHADVIEKHVLCNEVFVRKSEESLGLGLTKTCLQFC